MFPYILSGIGGAIMSFMTSMEDTALMGWVVGLACAGIGIFMTIRHEETRKDQLTDLAFHGGAFVIGIIAMYAFAVLFALVVLGIFLQFMGINVIGWFLGLLDGLGQNLDQEQIEESYTYVPDEEPEEEYTTQQVEVWRENGYMKEHLKVSSDGQRYYDPEDGKWHNIKK